MKRGIKMLARNQNILWLVLTASIATLMIWASASGAFMENFYARDVASIGASTSGQDLFNLVIVLPIFLISAVLMLRHAKWALPVWLGCLAYILYDYLILAFGIYFNNMFLVYVALVGLTVYTLILAIPHIDARSIRDTMAGQASTHVLQGLLVFIAVLFSVLWLAMVIPSLQKGTVPQELADNRLLTQPVHIVDLAWIMPGMILCVIAMFRRWHTAYVLAPAFAILTILMAGALGAMTLNVARLGLSTDLTLLAIFGVLLIACLVIFIWYERTASRVIVSQNPEAHDRETYRFRSV